MKIRKPISALLLAATLLTCLIIPSMSADVSELRTTGNPNDTIAVRVDGGTLYLAELPATDQFSSISVMLTDGEKYVLNRTVSRGSDGTVSLSLSGIADGRYGLEIYTFSGGSSYSSYLLGDDIIISVSSGKGAIELPAPYEHNLAVYSSKRTDSAAREYYLRNTNSIQSASPDIVNLALEITGGADTDYDKALKIHDWVAENIWYDFDLLETRETAVGDALTTLSRRHGVCEGYANLTAALLRAVGIPCKVVTGYSMDASVWDGWTEEIIADDSANHGWNEAYIGGRWVIIDTTWDCGNIYQNGRKTKSPGMMNRRYFDSTLEVFSTDHRISDYSESQIAAITAGPTTSAVTVNGEAVSFDAYNIEGNNFFKLRDLAYILSGTEKQFEVEWDGENNAIVLTSKKAYTPVGGEMTAKGSEKVTPKPTASKIILDGKEISFTAYNIKDNNYFKLRDIGRAFDFATDWDGASNTVVIDTSKPYKEDNR